MIFNDDSGDKRIRALALIEDNTECIQCTCYDNNIIGPYASCYDHDYGYGYNAIEETCSPYNYFYVDGKGMVNYTEEFGLIINISK